MCNVFGFYCYGCGEPVISKEELIKCIPHVRKESMMRPMSRVVTRVVVLQRVGTFNMMQTNLGPSQQVRCGIYIISIALIQATGTVHLTLQDTTYPSSAPLSFVYFNGMNREECVAPIPGRPCLTGLLFKKISPSVRANHRILLVPRTMRY